LNDGIDELAYKKVVILKLMNKVGENINKHSNGLPISLI